MLFTPVRTIDSLCWASLASKCAVLLQVADVLFSASLGYLIVELRSQVTPKELWALDPDGRQLRRLGNSTDLVGAVVALAPGVQSSYLRMHLRTQLL